MLLEERWAAAIDEASDRLPPADVGYLTLCALELREELDRGLSTGHGRDRLATRLAALGGCFVATAELAEREAGAALCTGPGDTRYQRLVAGGVNAVDQDRVGRGWETEDASAAWDLVGFLLSSNAELGFRAATDEDALSELGLQAWDAAQATIAFATVAGISPEPS